MSVNMTKINFSNGGQPAINDYNLNKLQDNIEDAIEEVATDVIAKASYSTSEKQMGTWVDRKTRIYENYQFWCIA